MRIPPEHFPKRLMRDNHAGDERSAGGLSVELIDDTIDQSGDVREKAAIVAEERPKRLRDGEDELSMR